MAQHVRKQSEWPIVKREPDAYVLVPDVYERTDRGVAGPLRFGTVRNGVGPRGPARSAEGRGEVSDYGMDRVSPRSFDPMGTSIARYTNPKRDADLISQNPAPRSNRRGSGEGHD
jgi:hypothetical protein